MKKWEMHLQVLTNSNYIIHYCEIPTMILTMDFPLIDLCTGPLSRMLAEGLET